MLAFHTQYFHTLGATALPHDSYTASMAREHTRSRSPSHVCTAVYGRTYGMTTARRAIATPKPRSAMRTLSWRRRRGLRSVASTLLFAALAVSSHVAGDDEMATVPRNTIVVNDATAANDHHHDGSNAMRRHMEKRAVRFDHDLKYHQPHRRRTTTYQPGCTPRPRHICAARPSGACIHLLSALTRS